MSDSSNTEIAKNLHFYWNPIGGKDEARCAEIRKMYWYQGAISIITSGKSSQSLLSSHTIYHNHIVT